MKINYRFQLLFFLAYIVVQTILLRTIYFQFGRAGYKVTAWIIFPLFATLVMFFVSKNKWSLKDLGIRTDNLLRGLPLYLLVTLAFGLGLYFLKQYLGRPFYPKGKASLQFSGLFIFSSFLQEFLFRGYLIKLQKKIINNNTWLLLLNALIFGFMHTMVITESVLFSFFTTFFLGLFWAYAYLKHPNLFLVGISHSALNYMVTMFGFFSFRQ